MQHIEIIGGIGCCAKRFQFKKKCVFSVSLRGKAERIIFFVGTVGTLGTVPANTSFAGDAVGTSLERSGTGELFRKLYIGEIRKVIFQFFFSYIQFSESRSPHMWTLSNVGLLECTLAGTRLVRGPERIPASALLSCNCCIFATVAKKGFAYLSATY